MNMNKNWFLINSDYTEELYYDSIVLDSLRRKHDYYGVFNSSLFNVLVSAFVNVKNDVPTSQFFNKEYISKEVYNFFCSINYEYYLINNHNVLDAVMQLTKDLSKNHNIASLLVDVSSQTDLTINNVLSFNKCLDFTEVDDAQLEHYTYLLNPVFKRLTLQEKKTFSQVNGIFRKFRTMPRYNFKRLPSALLEDYSRIEKQDEKFLYYIEDPSTSVRDEEGLTMIYLLRSLLIEYNRPIRFSYFYSDFVELNTRQEKIDYFNQLAEPLNKVLNYASLFRKLSKESVSEVILLTDGEDFMNSRIIPPFKMNIITLNESVSLSRFCSKNKSIYIKI